MKTRRMIGNENHLTYAETDERTPLPWRVGDAGHTVFGPPNGNPSPYTVATELDPPDAALIVHRVNIHDEIVRQLEAAVLILENHPGVSVDTSGFKALLSRASQGGDKL